jgi:hypothetical protein
MKILPNNYSVFSAADSFAMVNQDGDRTASAGLLLYNGGTVCKDEFNDHAAVAICKKMGYDGSNTGWSSIDPTDWGIQDNYEIKLDNVNCRGDAWEECDVDANPKYCDHDEYVFLACGGPGIYVEFSCLNLASFLLFLGGAGNWMTGPLEL